MKHRKLNSTNPKYHFSSTKVKQELKRILMCTTHHGCKVYGVWYKD